MSWGDAADLFVKFQGPAIAVLVVGASAWWFLMQRHLARQIEFDVDALPIKTRDGKLICEYTATLMNKGKVRAKFKFIKMESLVLKDSDDIAMHDGNRLKFPTKILDIENIMAKRGHFDFIFIEPGITQRFRLTGPLPADTVAILVRGEFEYRNKWPHTAEKLVLLP